MNYGLKDSAIEKINTVFSHHSEVEQVILYGSRAKGNYKPYSDIDFTLKGKSLDLSLKWKIENELDDLLLPYKIDMSLLRQIDNPDVVSHINRVGKVFYERTGTA
jgi:predicted nucleotidyltransferase